MSSEELKDERFVEIIDECEQELPKSERDGAPGTDEQWAQAPANFSPAAEPGFEKKYSINDLQKLSEYLNRESSSRYRAIVLNVWSGALDAAHFEVGLVQIRNGDHRNGVVHALRVSPFNVKFVQLEDSFFEYLYSHIYDERTQSIVLEHQQKKQSQKTKNWGEGKTFLTAEEAYSTNAASEADLADQSEEWIDLTDRDEYERNIRRNEAELTTQEFIRLILMEFLRSGSSDMHIEAGQPMGRIRFRYDSEMFVRWDNIPFVKIKQLCMGMAETSGKDATQMKFKDIDSTVKVRALRDGRTAEVELRFVSQPTLYAPSIVLRSQLKPIRDLNEVGFLPRQIADLRAAYTQKRGILIVTGATGSGKTNTLESIYAALEETDSFKIIEIGEPIEIRSPFRTQMSLRPNTPFTWWDAFYSCLRADPDIIGIGELRSSEHASVAINAALTGHLVLSTFHAASVEDTLSRMFQLGLPRENLSTGLNLILAQALIKKLCERCRIVDPHPSEIYEKEVYKSVGCPDCFNKGTRGRTAMAELLYFNDEVKEWVEDRSLTARDVVQKAVRAGYLMPMKDVARQKVLAGVTSEMEVAAVLGLVESKRQFTNREFEQAAIDDQSRAAQEAIERYEAFGKG
ncbi:MAG TPA: ATPase, T2SS/T4P/T4SS family [Pyrinomonadaceae bacterium]|nr:ATPase, T2SS/T4P/T4SS family [Pyrinomonadaceae bacterium]